MRMVVLESVDMFSFLGVMSTNPPEEEEHVHQLTVSPLRARRLPVRRPNLRAGHHDLPHRTTPRASSLLPLPLGLRLGPGAASNATFGGCPSASSPPSSASRYLASSVSTAARFGKSRSPLPIPRNTTPALSSAMPSISRGS